MTKKQMLEPGEEKIELLNDHYSRLLVNCVKQLHESQRDVKKYLLTYAYTLKPIDPTQLKQTRDEIDAAHELICILISESARPDFDQRQLQQRLSNK